VIKLNKTGGEAYADMLHTSQQSAADVLLLKATQADPTKRRGQL
jgi:hypothetical protein